MARLAALSSAEISPRICSASGLAAPRTRFCNVRSRVRTMRFWFARATDCRERLAADFVLAMALVPKIYGAWTVAQTAKMSRCRSWIRPADRRQLWAANLSSGPRPKQERQTHKFRDRPSWKLLAIDPEQFQLEFRAEAGCKARSRRSTSSGCS